MRRAGGNARQGVNLLDRQGLLWEQTELEKAIEKMAYSNAELHEFDPEGTDVLIQESIADNETTLARYRDRLAAVLARLQAEF
mmetsp:Transcript_17467/g.44529  ORF Transcript_17467/g.44529 Transcript_17467/m.44529 type:complete len:83 (-) Transcript_17467:284-532(-)